MHETWLSNGRYGSRLIWFELSSSEQDSLRNADLRDCNLRNANLENANLENANLENANLYNANLEGANLEGADLRYTNLKSTNLKGADLEYADLKGADLESADLKGTNLIYTNLKSTNLKGADLEDANLKGASHYQIQCPEVGSFIAFKKLIDNRIAKLEIPEYAKRSSATSRKCRANTAKVLEIFNAQNHNEKFEIGYSIFNMNFEYKVGEFVSPDRFDDDRFNECSNGIHFFITLQEAIDY